MLLRFRGPDGMVRLDIEPDSTFAQLGDKVSISLWILSSSTY